jgi:superfamily II DNA or RNA helicase
MPVILHDKIYIPCEYVQEDEAREKYTFRFYDEPTCRSCMFRRDRHCADCESCEFGGFKGSVCTMNYKTVDGEAYFGFPMGDLDRIEDKLGIVFEELGIEDRTCKAKLSKDFRSKFKMNIKLYQYQEDAVLDLLDYKIGGLQSKPRTGKTTMAVNLMTRTPYKVLVIANQKDYLDGFIRELSEHTNIDELEGKLGRKLYGFPKKDKDWEEFEIIMVTYQSLIQDDNPKHKWRMSQLRKYRGLCVLDEAHKSAATTFAKVMSQITSRMRIQLSGTFNRKDKRHLISRVVMGPIVHKTDAEVLKPKLSIHRITPKVKTKAKFTGMGGWTRLTKHLANDSHRNEAIIASVLRDLDKGRSIAIPVYHIEHAKMLVREINYRYGDEIAATFLGGAQEAKKRETTILRARAGEIKVVVGIRSLIQTGINIAQWSCLYYVMPMNNQPNWEQESNRICTPLEGKRTPLIRFIVDPNFVQAFGCFKSTLSQSLALGHTLTKRAKAKAIDYGINIDIKVGDTRHILNDVTLGRTL